MDELMTPDEIAARLKIERRSFLRTVATRPDFPAPVRLGQRIVRWHAEQVEQWIQRSTRRAA
jgi:predicted DNA-binding transcriptional regulator AlpA